MCTYIPSPTVSQRLGLRHLAALNFFQPYGVP